MNAHLSTAPWRVRSIVTAVLLAFVVTALPPAAGLAQTESPDAVAEDVVFDGGGWGHGVGMSQYGAFAMSVLGSDHKDILRHYFQGANFRNLGTTAPLWVNLERDFEEVILRVEAVGASDADVVLTRPGKTVIAEVGATIKLVPKDSGGCRAIVTHSDGDKSWLPSKNCNIDMTWYDWETEGVNPTTKLVIDGCTLANWNTSPTSFPECQYARGMLHLRDGEGGMDLSVELLREDYVLGISEMPYYWADEGGVAALEAQAIAARSYARELQKTRGWVGNNSCDGWCHVRDTTFDQRYVGWGHGNTSWVAAVEATDSVGVGHPDAPNGVVRTYYFSSSAGLTEMGHERFGGDPAEYYTSVDDSWAVDGTVTNPNATWTESIAAADVAAELDFDELTAVSVIATRTSGSAETVRYEGIVDGATVTTDKSGSWTRTTFGLKSEWFEVDYSAPVPEEPANCVLVEAGDGWWAVTERLGLPGSEWPTVREANLHAENESGYLIIGAEVCEP